MDYSDLIQEFVEEALLHIEDVEIALLKLENGTLEVDTIHNIFRAVHSIKGTAGFFSLKNIVDLSHHMENLFGQIREGNLNINEKIIDISLAANDKLKKMISDIQNSDQEDISGFLTAIEEILANQPESKAKVSTTPEVTSLEPMVIERTSAEAENKIFNNEESNFQILTFYLCGNLYGLDIKIVKEINRNIEYTPVPDAPPHIIGLLNMRGQVVTIFNLAKLIGYEQQSKKSNCIILKSETNDPDYIGFLIDSPGFVVEVDNNECEPPPANISKKEKKFISKIAKLEKELLRIINWEAILNSNTKND